MNSMIESAFEYGVDAMQRSILFTDIMRKRGNNYLAHLSAGQPPVLVFDYEIIMDGRELDPPSNYKLAHIAPPKGCKIDPKKRPVIIVDPRAGHGPGIGGSKRDSEIGMALEAGHPVYFILFETEPITGQTIAHVEQTEIAFIEEVVRRHPQAPKPSVTGNCQAGWALAMLSADRPGTTGPIVLNGSPLSYWAGLEGKDTMRYLGAVLGGTWLNSLSADLGAGIFDGAHLVMNFELMNLANTLWNKQYHVWTNVDSEEKRYLDFERWWGGFFNMTKEEIHFIVNNLFVDNRLESGGVQLREGSHLSLKDIQDPIVVFCSAGDAITPPQQALNWIVHVWDSVDEIRRRGQVIVYMIHESIGHLGIFVSGKVAAKEHKEMIDSFDMIELLPPGLYEMVIENDEEDIDPNSNYLVRFEEREVEDILALDDNMTEEEESFPLVSAVSQRNDKFYNTFISPWIKMFTTAEQAESRRRLHPLRMSRVVASDLNPVLGPVEQIATAVRANRNPVADDNPFLGMERAVSTWITTGLEQWNRFNGLYSELFFQTMYSPQSFLNWFYPEAAPKPPSLQEILDRRLAERQRIKGDKQYWLSKMRSGGFVEGLARAVIAITSADNIIEREEYARLMHIAKTHSRFKGISTAEFGRIVRQQSRILQSNEPMAIETLPDLLPSPKDHQDLIEICTFIFEHDDLHEETRDMIQRLKSVFEKKLPASATKPAATAKRKQATRRRTKAATTTKTTAAAAKKTTTRRKKPAAKTAATRKKKTAE